QLRGAHELRLRRARRHSRPGFEPVRFNLLAKILKIVAQVVGDLIAPIRILLQAAPNDPGKVTRQILAQLGDRLRNIPENRGYNLRTGFTPKGSAAGGQLIKNDTQREDVRTVVNGSALRLLGRHVKDRAQELAIAGQTLG